MAFFWLLFGRLIKILEMIFSEMGPKKGLVLEPV
jgi:hypothetical protein